MSLTIDEEVTLEEIDEALSHLNTMLKTDQYGNRMDWRKKELLKNSMDDLLDVRLRLVKEGKTNEWRSITNASCATDNLNSLYPRILIIGKNLINITWPITTRSRVNKSPRQVVQEIFDKVKAEMEAEKEKPDNLQ